MTNEEIQKIIPFIGAILKGECEIVSSKTDGTIGTFSCSIHTHHKLDSIVDYFNQNRLRIKSKPKYRPFTQDDCHIFTDAMFRLKNTAFIDYEKITGFNNEAVYFGDDDATYQQLFDNFDMFIKDIKILKYDLNKPLIAGVLDEKIYNS
jgi:hypothetical protein